LQGGRFDLHAHAIQSVAQRIAERRPGAKIIKKGIGHQVFERSGAKLPESFFVIR